MSFRWQVTFWLAALAVFVLILWLLHEILLPFVAGMVLAYLLDPVAKRLERLGVNRLLATLLIVGLFVVGFLVLCILVVPLLGGQLTAFIERLPGTIARLQALASDQSRPWLRQVLGEGIRDADVGELVKQGAGWLTGFMRSLWSGGQALLSVFSLLIVTPVVAFYLLNDWDRMIDAVDSWVPRQHRTTVHALAREINTAIAGFVRGQTAVCLLLGSFYAVSLALTGLNFGLLIGLVSGLITFIPYLGSMTGLVLGVAVAIAQFWPEWTPILVVAGIFLVGQFVEGYLLAPKLVGESAGLHPVWLMFAIFAFGYLFGFVGLLVAVPLAAAFGVIARFALRQYRASPLYTGVPQHASVPQQTILPPHATVPQPLTLPPQGGGEKP
jgi:predicted PurR-regulated permease PerM